MFESLERAIDAARESVRLVECDTLTAAEAARLVTLFGELQRLAGAGRTLAVGHAVRSRAWHGSVHRTPAEWVAEATRVSMKEAVDAVQTAERLRSLPATRAALVAGRLSESQVVAVAAAAGEVPAAETHLLDAAERESVRGLRLECARVTAAAVTDDAERYERIRRTRSVRHWLEPDGAFRLEARLTPDVGARVAAAIRRKQAEIFERERRAGRREPRAAYAADAFAGLVLGVGGEQEGRPIFRLHCDLSALRRGRVVTGETCEIAGFGPVPVAAARELFGESLLEIVLSRGRDVTGVAYAGRMVPAALRRVIEARDPVCVVEGCDETEGLELDHNTPVWEGGLSSRENLNMLCGFDHYLKTCHGYRIIGPPGGPMKLIEPNGAGPPAPD